MFPQLFFLWTVATIYFGDSLVIVSPFSQSPSKYIQGLHYTNGNLFYGTNEGNLCCITRNDNAKLQQKWFRPISSRNIQRIKGNDKSLLITCDSVYGEAGRSVVCDMDSGHVMDNHVWKDTTIFETLTDSNEWIRVNAQGEMVTKVLHRETEFTLKYRIPMSSMDFVTCATIHNDRLYAITMNGKMFVVNLERLEIETWHAIHLQLPTCIHVVSPHGTNGPTNSVFVYVANQSGTVYFTQITEGHTMSHTMKQVHHAVATQIDSNHQGVFISFGDSHIVGLEMLSFRQLYSIKTENPCYTNVDSFCLSPRGLFFIDNRKNEIRMETIAKGQGHRNN